MAAVPTAPLFIGMPVHNGGARMAKAIETLLEQSYRDFCLVISDNGSVDDTARVAESFARRDSRVHVVQVQTNQGPTWNFNRLLDLGSHHRYFMWAAHDDFWLPDYLAMCIAELEARPTLVLCGTRARFVGGDAMPTGEEDFGVTTVGLDRVERALKYIAEVGRNSIFYGIYRTETLRNRQIPLAVGGDHAFLFELSLIGEILTMPQTLLIRQARGTSVDAASIYRALGIRPILAPKLLRIDVFRTLLECVSSMEDLTPDERRRLRWKLLKTGMRRHVLPNLSLARLVWWIRYGGTSRGRHEAE